MQFFNAVLATGEEGYGEEGVGEERDGEERVGTGERLQPRVSETNGPPHVAQTIHGIFMEGHSTKWAQSTLSSLKFVNARKPRILCAV